MKSSIFETSNFKPKAKEIAVGLKGENTTLNGLKILHISDLHIDKSTPFESLNNLVAVINQSDAQFVVITGDIIDIKTSNIEDKLNVLKNIKKQSFYISGNHDLFYGLNSLKNRLNSFGFICLDNDFVILSHNHQRFCLAGLSDRFSKFFNIKRKEKVLIDTINQLALPTVFLAHQPKDIEFALQCKASLFLCGHTHGGQIFPFHLLVKLVQPYLSGLHYKNSTAIYVNKGVGTWGIGYRFFASSEIALLKLVTNEKSVE
ncbi:MAG: metallophosphoesterase [Candidatus Marinarcus sp.]|uniref:metallophosphoesterase n=1 Tax=Candidatus Marinarcus sp. TaxID=3100987 RepID=UPI003AFF7ABB